MARAMSHVGQEAYLCDFSFAETGKRAPLGAYHGEELYLLSNSFPADWQDSWDDQLRPSDAHVLGTVCESRQSECSRPLHWPDYDVHADQHLDLGRTIKNPLRQCADS